MNTYFITLLSLASPKAPFIRYTAGENTPNLALFPPMYIEEGRLIRVVDGIMREEENDKKTRKNRARRVIDDDCISDG